MPLVCLSILADRLDFPHALGLLGPELTGKNWKFGRVQVARDIKSITTYFVLIPS